MEIRLYFVLYLCVHSCVCTVTCSQLGGWGVSGQWNRSDFNSALSMLIMQYSSFPFFNLYVGRDPHEIARGTSRKYIQASIPQMTTTNNNTTTLLLRHFTKIHRLLLTASTLYFQQIDEPDLLIPIEWNNKTQKSIAKTQVKTSSPQEPLWCHAQACYHCLSCAYVLMEYPFFVFCFVFRLYCRSWRCASGTWRCWALRPASASTTWASSSLCPLSWPWPRRPCPIACSTASSTSASPSKSCRYI